MYQQRVTAQAKSEVHLVLYGYAKCWEERPGLYDQLVNQALLAIKTNPTSGKRKRVAGVDVYTYHLGRRKRAVHYFLYRVVGDLVEVGRLLHQEMEVEGNLPAEWLPKAA